jgi:hypothetical protein
MAMKYRSGYKYQLAEGERVQTAIRPPQDIVCEFLALSRDGVLYISPGYAWDGATCFPDFKSIMRGSLIHDALYQLLRSGDLPPHWKDSADEELRIACIQDGMWKWLANSVYAAVQRFGKGSTEPEARRPIMVAP